MTPDSTIKAAAWKAIKAWFETDCGLTTEKAGKIVGKWNRDYGFVLTMSTIIECEIKRNKFGEPADPIPWIEKCLRMSDDRKGRVEIRAEDGLKNLASLARSGIAPHLRSRFQRDQIAKNLDVMLSAKLIDEQQAERWR